MAAEKTDLSNHNFETIIPSAKSLLLMKGHTSIPYARQAAKLMEYPKPFVPDFGNKNVSFWARVVHFEKRYRSVDQLLSDLPIKNILELSSGFSFRGFEYVKQNGCNYIDTDLPAVIETKKTIIAALTDESFYIKGKLEMLPLNVLDEEQFSKITNHFPEGHIVIVNEGLLMYLTTDEKETLCRNIHKVLNEHGGYWITADIYIKNRHKLFNFEADNKTKEFFEKHSIEYNKFESFEEADAFFMRMGFIVDKEADVNSSEISSIKYFLKTMTKKQLIKIRNSDKIQATWRLRVADDKSLEDELT